MTNFNIFEEKMMKIEMDYIPLDKYNCFLLTMNINKANYLYHKECSRIFEFFNELKYHVIFVDELIFNYDGIIMLDSMSKLVEDDILVMTFKVSY